MLHVETSRLFLCHPACVHQKDHRLSLASHLASQDVLANAPLTFTHKSTHLLRHACKCTVEFHSQVSHFSRRACKCTVDFHSQVSHFSRRARKCTVDFHSQVSHLSRRARKCTIDFHSQVTSLLTSPIWEACHCGTVLFSWCSHLALVSLILPQHAKSSVHRMPTVGLVLLVVQYLLRYCNTSSGTGSHSTLSYLVCGASSCLNELVIATRCHHIKINRVLFPLTVLRSLIFLIPPFTKINMSSYPVVHLLLTFAWGLLGMCHKDGSLAVLSPLWLERLETLLEVVPFLSEKLKWLHHLSRLWSPLPCCKQIDNCHGISVAWPHFPMCAEEIPLAWQTDHCRGICFTL